MYKLGNMSAVIIIMITVLLSGSLVLAGPVEPGHHPLQIRELTGEEKKELREREKWVQIEDIYFFSPEDKARLDAWPEDRHASGADARLMVLLENHDTVPAGDGLVVWMTDVLYAPDYWYEDYEDLRDVPEADWNPHELFGMYQLVSLPDMKERRRFAIEPGGAGFEKKLYELFGTYQLMNLSSIEVKSRTVMDLGEIEFEKILSYFEEELEGLPIWGFRARVYVFNWDMRLSSTASVILPVTWQVKEAQLSEEP